MRKKRKMGARVAGIYKITVTPPRSGVDNHTIPPIGERDDNHTPFLYIGKSNDIVQRYHQHQSALRSGKHANHIMQQLYDKHGPACFELTLIEIVDDVSSLERREVYWIQALEPAINIMSTKLSPADIVDIKYKLSVGQHLDEVAHAYNISVKYLREILRGGRWKRE